MAKTFFRPILFACLLLVAFNLQASSHLLSHGVSDARIEARISPLGTFPDCPFNEIKQFLLVEESEEEEHGPDPEYQASPASIGFLSLRPVLSVPLSPRLLDPSHLQGAVPLHLRYRVFRI